jgi:hypothetical protein
VVVHDPQLITADSTYLPTITTSYILSGLFDLLFMAFLERVVQSRQLKDISSFSDELVGTIANNAAASEDLKALVSLRDHPLPT